MILGRKQQAQGMPIRPANLWSQEKNSVRATRLWWAFTAFDDILSGHQFGPVIKEPMAAKRADRRILPSR